MINTLTTNFNKLWKSVAIGGTMLAYQAFYDRIKSKSAFIEQKNDILKELERALQQKSMGNNLQEQTTNSSIDLPLPTTVNTITSDTTRIIDSYNQEIGKLITKCNNLISDLEKFLEDNNINKKLFEDNFISNLIKDFKDYLSTLSIEQLCILMNFLLITIVFSCLITILFAFYGNFFIDKFSLEEKYPKLSGIIKLRRKFQHYYIITNSLIITFALLFMGYVNLLTLLNGS
jgi:hypothetical protein